MSTNLDQETMLENYIDDLLTPIQPVTKPASIARLSIVQSSQVADEKQRKAHSKPQDVDKTEPKFAQVQTSSDNKECGSPDWLDKKFIACVCKVNNMKLAIPSSMVSGQFDYSKDLKEVKNSPDWVIGLKITDNNFTAVIDTGHLLLNQYMKGASNYKHIIALKDSKWGLAVDEVIADVEIVSSKVNWRKETKNRRWLIGIDSIQNLAIVDANKIFEEDK